MGRARRARKIAATAAYGGGGLAAASAALGVLGYAVVRVEGAIARRLVGNPFDGAPAHEGSYGHGPGAPVNFVVIGDSTAAGLGADEGHQTIGAIIAGGLAALLGRRVQLTNRAVVGAESSDLERQFAEAVDEAGAPDLVVIMIGANDVTHRVDRASAVRHLETTVRRARALGAEVVVGTCPDLGTVEPVPQPLRLLMRRWSRDLAAAQTVAVVEAGGRTVSLADLLGGEFSASPRELFATDRYHPSAAGYARVAAALLPTVCAALGVWGGPGVERAAAGADARDADVSPADGEARVGLAPRHTQRLVTGARPASGPVAVEPVAVAAGHAVREPGTEVSPTEVGGHARGPRGRWAALRRRRPAAPTAPALPAETTAQSAEGSAPAAMPEGESPDGQLSGQLST